MEIPKIPSWLRNFFFLFTLGFLLWMFFLDINDLPSQFQRSQEIRSLEQEKAFYEQEIEKVKGDRKKLLTDDAMLEKFAREKYLMKKPSEDVYVLEKQ
ncbi:FtsB family cell division protein [Tunicatimonas pelagia]|uniref:FtsB family cell division protein n=1 Tax=Tunicatimonas pelagia TaxID=931531 RepID=UPI0026663822|nr:septum formation initiator family protein [Tunicatimonas pelagia]WKN42283.1 septum formation initiator family protein [Tunicatimonas pelagia]